VVLRAVVVLARAALRVVVVLAAAWAALRLKSLPRESSSLVI